MEMNAVRMRYSMFGLKTNIGIAEEVKCYTWMKNKPRTKVKD